MNTLTLPKKAVEYLLYGDAAAEERYGLVEVAKVMGDEWRWGYWWTLVIEDISDGSLWAVDYQVQTGDNYWNSLESKLETNNSIKFYKVIPKIISKTIYVRASDD